MGKIRGGREQQDKFNYIEMTEDDNDDNNTIEEDNDIIEENINNNQTSSTESNSDIDISDNSNEQNQDELSYYGYPPEEFEDDNRSYDISDNEDFVDEENNVNTLPTQGGKQKGKLTLKRKRRVNLGKRKTKKTKRTRKSMKTKKSKRTRKSMKSKKSKRRTNKN